MFNADESSEDNDSAVEIRTVAQDDGSAHAGMLAIRDIRHGKEMRCEHPFLGGRRRSSRFERKSCSEILR